MTLALKLYQKGEGQPQLLRERSFDGSHVTIGRGAECALPLEDPKKWVSRVHAEISIEGRTYWLTVVSKVNPVIVNGERHAPGSRLVIQGGDRLDIGEYQIEVVSPPDPSVVAPPPIVEPAEATFMGEPAPEPEIPSEPDIVLEPDILLEADPEPVAAPSSTPVAKAEPVSEPAPVPAPAPKVAPAPADDGVFAEATFMGGAPPAGFFDEPTMVGRSQSKTEETEESVEDSVFREVTLLHRLPPPEDGLFEDSAASEPVQDAVPAATPPAPLPTAMPAAQVEPDVAPEDRSVFMEATLMRAASTETTFPQPGDGQERMQVDAEPARALEIFLEGAGLPQREFANSAEREQFLRQCGAIVRASVEGVMALLVARAEAKKEFRAEDRTMVASRDNNPLKLMADPQEALEFLFDPKERSGGFLTPVQAVGDAFEDMRAHEAALIAGMRAAILGALRRFDPKTLEEELTKAAGGGLGLNKKAKLWDLFAAYQQKLARDAEDDFNKVFGRDFMGSYMAQVRQLKKK